MKYALRAYGIGLLIYTGYRTWSFMVEQLPQGEAGQIVALLFLLSSEAGLLLWHELSLQHTTTTEQHAISISMTWICFLASTGAGIGDMILKQTLATSYQVPPILTAALMYGLPLIMALNVAASLLYFQSDADLQLERSQRELKFEIYRQTIAEVKAKKKAVAKDLQPELYAQICNDVTTSVRGELIRENGQVAYASEADSKNLSREAGQ